MLALLTPVVMAGLGFLLFDFVGFTGETLPVFRPKPWLVGKTAWPVADSSNAVSKSVDDNASDWQNIESTQFLGTNRNGVIQNDSFSTAWQEQLPKVLWKIPIGAGWSSFAVADALAVTLEQIDDQESLTAFKLQTGEIAWRLKTPGRHTQAVGGVGPRSTPTIRGDKVYAQSALGIVSCVELLSGKLIWQQDLLKMAGIDQESSEKAISWGRSGSPLVFDSQVVVPFGSKSGDDSLRSLVSFDSETGKELWRNGKDQIAYSSPVLLTMCGVRQIAIINEGHATGHSPNDGTTLWSTPWPSSSNGDACSSQPVAVDDRRLLLGKGYALGSKMVELTFSGSNPTDELNSSFWKAETVWSTTKILKTKFTSATAFQGHLYGLSDGILECIEPKDGTRVWRGKKYGHGQSIIVNGHILVTTEDGRIVLIPASASGQGKEIAQMQVLEGITWNVPAVAGPYLLIRNAELAACLISEKDRGDAGSAAQ